jgi:ribosomal protein L37AE/L43A
VIASLAYRKPLRPSRRSLAAAETIEALPARGSTFDTTPIARSMRHKASPVSKKPSGKSGKRGPARPKKASAKTSAKPTRKPLLSKQKKTVGTTVIRKRSSKKIVIAPVEEHRCPYCLEPVKRNDPRGVVECDVCHTLHHADCWAITGTCQVPHYNH